MDDRVRDFLKYGATFALLVAVFFGGSYALKGVLGTEYPVMVVVSQSMVPTLGVGDFIFIGDVDPAQVTAAPYPRGDVIVFLRPYTSDEYIVHRAIAESTNGGSLTFTTKGDFNAVQDGWRLPAANVVGKVVGNIPLLGYFSIFIKTLYGFVFVGALIAVSFLLDYVLPPRQPAAGRFPAWAALPSLSAPALIVLLWFIPTGHQYLEYVALGLWYVSCLLLPLAFHDDDSATMAWLYGVVLFMIPIACDLVWWTTGITPSMWWSTQGSAIQANWMLLRVTPMFEQAFTRVMVMLLPGCAVFLVVLVGKRRAWGQFAAWSRTARGAPPDEGPRIEYEPYIFA